ncbi:MAG: DUF937 domain-containing protein [Cyanobacteria bacterium P01_D01_bin.128]
MGLFYQVMQAIDDPDRQANMGQLGQMAAALQQVSRAQDADAGSLQQVVSVVGGYVKSSLNEKRRTEGTEAAEAIVDRGSQSGTAALSALFNQSQQQEVSQAAAQRSGIDAAQIQKLLPVVLPLVLQFLNSGSSKTAKAQPGPGTSNALLRTFLDGDSDGDVDMGDMLNMASRFMK